MQTYEHPITHETFRASTDAHAAARVFGGKPEDFLTARKVAPEFNTPVPWDEWVEVTRYTPEGDYEWTFEGDINVPEPV